MTTRPPDPGLYRKLVWSTLFRIVTLAVLLGGTAAMSWRAHGEPDATLTPVYGIVAFAFAASATFGLVLRRRAHLEAVAYAQSVLDVGIATILVAATGGTESIFVFMFSLAVVNGAVLLFRRGAFVAAALSTAAYLGVVLSSRPIPAVTVFVHIGAFVATAALAAYLAEQLRTTGERLAASESDLASLTALHEAVVQSMTGGLLTLDPGGRITFLNRAGEQIAGLPLEAVRGRLAGQVFPAFQGGVSRDEVDVTSPSGAHLRLGYSSFPLADRAGARLGTAVIFQDLTHLRAMEEAVKRSERLADLGALAAGLAHELRNPLAAMMGSIELLRGQAGEEERRLMDIVLREAERLNALVTDFLRFARPAPLRREKVDLGRLLGEVLEVFAQAPVAANVRLDRELTTAWVTCDAAQVRQIAWNLILNAAQALDGASGGCVRVTCAGAKEGGATFSVADDGPGIAPEDVARVFLPFHSSRPGGTGLGLPTVQRIVDAHRGSVAVRTRPLEGTTITVTLPEALDP